ncbi:MAG: NADH-quinone oxidoreductase subunit D [SAR202 cluster bacterium]|uniref:NADH-quinone oxidoreductase subunit D domain-containing protein n=2 Tax=ecological metagenomes TaxID=410657 RepID=A0A381P1H5_9ZZZZ|nr:NADH-quinone oxidoreductase subunit D [Chloroflexota bacterium]MQG15047.1 NADH-quinone oxidoreductase subunit D [SAR202 cluster bacterium]MEE3166057.1 NADH-quinone oxidoreductase subunit D [Chloroflexota bacterium]MQG31060.1 NADH-quinone oxidoreductase subunit D [SAR202 cluster bacterium]MQG40910.1 NADH-quinone oxidoreductase subunit D [SAR202 cluster bacterium]
MTQTSDSTQPGTIQPTRNIVPNAEPVEMLLNMGPQHPSTHGVFRMVLWVDGEKIVDVVPHIGYLHRGSEKLCEGEQYHQVITLFDRMDYIANFNNEQVYCRAVEKLMGLEVSERSEYIRVILCELNRIASHMLFIATMGLDAGAMTPSMFCFRGRERIQGLFESVSGARMMHNYFRIGGLKEDVPENFVAEVREVLDLVKKDTEESDKLLSFNEIFLARLKNIAVMTAEDAIDYGLTGPCLRASGVDYDLRKAVPYSVYDRFDFDVPIGLDGDCWDRYYLRVQEVYQSVRIIEQALDQLPDGEVVSSLGRRLIRPPAGEVYVRGENPRGEIGVYLVSDGADRPYRVKVRPPSFCNLSSLKHMLKDAWIADSVVILGALDIVLGEVDR